MRTETKDNHDFTYEELAQYFHKPINEVSQELGICATLLKKICRKNGINRWPHRKIKSLDKMIESFEELAKTEPDDSDAISNDIVELKEKREFLLQNPNVSYNSVLPKHCVNAYNARIQKNEYLLHSSRCAPTKSLKPTKTIEKSIFERYPRRSTRNIERPGYQGQDLLDDQETDDEEYTSPEEVSDETPSDPPIEEESAACFLIELHHTGESSSNMWESNDVKLETSDTHLPFKLRRKAYGIPTMAQIPNHAMHHRHFSFSSRISSTLSVL